MATSLIDMYLQKASNGEQKAISRLCEQLSERLLYVPVISQASGPAGESQIKVVQIVDGHRHLVPVFTTRERFVAWAEQHAHESGFISLLGADICVALAGDAWLVIDSGSESQMSLQPSLVAYIAGVGDSELGWAIGNGEEEKNLGFGESEVDPEKAGSAYEGSAEPILPDTLVVSEIAENPTVLGGPDENATSEDAAPSNLNNSAEFEEDVSYSDVLQDVQQNIEEVIKSTSTSIERSNAALPVPDQASYSQSLGSSKQSMSLGEKKGPRKSFLRFLTGS